MGPGLRFTVETHKQESVALCLQMWQTLSWSYNSRATLDLLYVHWHKNRGRIRCLLLFKGLSWKLRHECAVWTTEAMSSWFFDRQFYLLNIVPVFQWWGFIAFLCTISQINIYGFGLFAWEKFPETILRKLSSSIVRTLHFLVSKAEYVKCSGLFCFFIFIVWTTV